jgi:hypothetical protein
MKNHMEFNELVPKTHYANSKSRRDMTVFFLDDKEFESELHAS